MKQIIAAMAAMVISASSIAGIALSGKYTGTLNDSGVYTQDLTTTLVGNSAAGAVTVTLDKDFAVDDLQLLVLIKYLVVLLLLMLVCQSLVLR